MSDGCRQHVCRPLVPSHVFQTIEHVVRLIVINQRSTFSQQARVKVSVSITILLAGIAIASVFIFEKKCNKSSEQWIIASSILALIGLESTVQNVRILIAHRGGQSPLLFLTDLSDASIVLLLFFLGYRSVVGIVPSCKYAKFDDIQSTLVTTLLAIPPLYDFVKKMLQACHGVDAFTSFVSVLTVAGFAGLYKFISKPKSHNESSSLPHDPNQYNTETLHLSMLFSAFIVVQHLIPFTKKTLDFMADIQALLTAQEDMLDTANVTNLYVNPTLLLLPGALLVPRFTAMRKQYDMLVTVFANRSTPAPKVLQFITARLGSIYTAYTEPQKMQVQAVCSDWWTRILPSLEQLNIPPTLNPQASLDDTWNLVQRLASYVICATLMVREQSDQNSVFLWKMFTSSISAEQVPPRFQESIMPSVEELNDFVTRHPQERPEGGVQELKMRRNEWCRKHRLCTRWGVSDTDLQSYDEFLLSDILCLPQPGSPTWPQLGALGGRVIQYLTAPVGAAAYSNPGLAQIIISSTMQRFNALPASSSRSRGSLEPYRYDEDVDDWQDYLPNETAIQTLFCKEIFVIGAVFLFAFVPAYGAVVLLLKRARCRRVILTTILVLSWALTSLVLMRVVSERLTRIRNMAAARHYFAEVRA